MPTTQLILYATLIPKCAFKVLLCERETNSNLQSSTIMIYND